MVLIKFVLARALYDCFKLITSIRTKGIQKQPFKGFPSKRCSENMQQIYGRTAMPKCYFNKVAKQLY